MLAGLGTDGKIFVVMVFVAVVLLMTSVIVPTIGSEATANRMMRRRINRVIDSVDSGSSNLLRDRYLGELSPLERSLESIPGISTLRMNVMQAGLKKPAYMYLLFALTLGACAFIVVMLLLQSIFFAIPAALFATTIPFMYVSRQRAVRLAKFEEQLPEALEMMARALQAGHPFVDTLKMIGEEMNEPIGEEFQTVFNDINYGMTSKTAFLGLLTRVPSISLNTLITAVLIQQESGGKLAEILLKISAVIRSRFRLNRRVRTLSAEGRMSAWVLTLLPFVLAVVIALSTPAYLPMMTKDPLGVFITGAAFGLIVLGNFWIRKIIRFKY